MSTAAWLGIMVGLFGGSLAVVVLRHGHLYAERRHLEGYAEGVADQMALDVDGQPTEKWNEVRRRMLPKEVLFPHIRAKRSEEPEAIPPHGHPNRVDIQTGDTPQNAPINFKPGMYYMNHSGTGVWVGGNFLAPGEGRWL